MVQKKIKLIYLFSLIDKALLNEVITKYFSESDKFDFSIILMKSGSSELERFLIRNNIKHWSIPYQGKRDLIKTFYAILKILIKEKPDILNANLLDASMAGLPAAWISRIPVRILSRHHSDFHHTYHPHFVKYDKMLNRLATHIVVPSSVVKSLMIEKENVKADKIKVIHHGLPLEEFAEVEQDRVIQLKRQYGLTEFKGPVIGVISRFMHLKGIQYLIPAFSRLLQKYGDAHLILANAKGPYAPVIISGLSEIPKANYTLIDFEMDAPALYKLFDIFLHVPINSLAEAFGQVYIEALAAGIPSVFTLSGIALEFIRDKQNAVVTNYKDSDGIFDAMSWIMNNPQKVKEMTKQGQVDVFRQFHSLKMIKELEAYFLRTLKETKGCL
ncbi:MAG: glycosyltransferase family 4 protein [Bacteroidia bacterium]|nr:glycosyltransferase family 4 protein [Bacteroidia bacterium]